MKTLSFVLFLILNFQVLSQDPETIRVKLKLKSDGGYKYKVEYYALKSDTSIKHGEYKRYNIIKNLEETGYYKFGIKDSTWKTYSAGKMVNSIGNYHNGKKNGIWNYYINIPGGWQPTPTKSGNYSNDTLVGIWTYYFREGGIEQKFNHSDSTLVFQATKKEKEKYSIKINGEEKIEYLDRPPVSIGGNVGLSDNADKLDLSKLLSLAGDQEDISYELTFWIAANGETYGYTMNKGVNKDYDRMIIEHYKRDYKWIPGMYNAENVDCKYVVTVYATVQW